MFLINTKDGKSFNEGQELKDPEGNSKALTWDDVPKDIKISSLQLTYPFPVKFRNPDGTVRDEITPKLSLSGFSRYFFFNESTVPLLVQGQKILREGVASLEAKIIAGIDDKANLVLEFRMDKYGNCMVKKYPLKALQRSINEGIFRGEIIRNGD